MIASCSFRHLGAGLAVDAAKGIGTGDAVIATQPPRLQLSLRWVKMLQWWLCSVWKGSCCLQIVVLFFSCDYPCPLPLRGLRSAQISIRKGYFPKERSNCRSEPGGADRLGEGSPKTQVRIVASLKQQSRGGRNSRGQVGFSPSR